MKMSSLDATKVIEFSVRDMGGNATAYTAASIKELRVRLAIQAGVLSPCIVLLRHGRVIEDVDKIDGVFGKDMHSRLRHEVDVVNNLEAVKKKEVTDWSAKKWINAAKLHLRFGDQNVLQHAEPLITADSGFREKMRLWVADMISNISRTRNTSVDKCAEDIKAAIALGLGVQVANVKAAYEETLLHQAAEYGHTEVLLALLDAGADVNVRDQFGHTPLSMAACREHVEAFRALLNAGADPLLKSYHSDMPIINEAAASERADMVTLLIDAGVDVNVVNRQSLWKPLHVAASCGHAEVCRILIQAGANVEARDHWGKTPYDLAKNEECRRALLGANRLTHK